eukprot:Clim_evm143s210 gene=Clim_evmTU143s210
MPFLRMNSGKRRSRLFNQPPGQSLENIREISREQSNEGLPVNGDHKSAANTSGSSDSIAQKENKEKQVFHARRVSVGERSVKTTASDPDESKSAGRAMFRSKGDDDNSAAGFDSKNGIFADSRHQHSSGPSSDVGGYVGMPSFGSVPPPTPTNGSAGPPPRKTNIQSHQRHKSQDVFQNGSPFGNTQHQQSTQKAAEDGVSPFDLRRGHPYSKSAADLQDPDGENTRPRFTPGGRPVGGSTGQTEASQSYIGLNNRASSSASKQNDNNSPPSANNVGGPLGGSYVGGPKVGSGDAIIRNTSVQSAGDVSYIGQNNSATGSELPAYEPFPQRIRSSEAEALGPFVGASAGPGYSSQDDVRDAVEATHSNESGSGGGGGGGAITIPTGVRLANRRASIHETSLDDATLMKCDMCHETLEKPILLDCAHTMCLKHLEQCLVDDEDVECPMCGVRSNTRSGDRTLVRQDWLLEELILGRLNNNNKHLLHRSLDGLEGSVDSPVVLLDTVGGSDAGRKPSTEATSAITLPKVPCVNCGERDAVLYCTTCDARMCADCKTATHAARLFQTHNVQPMGILTSVSMTSIDSAALRETMMLHKLRKGNLTSSSNNNNNNTNNNNNNYNNTTSSGYTNHFEKDKKEPQKRLSSVSLKSNVSLTESVGSSAGMSTSGVLGGLEFRGVEGGMGETVSFCQMHGKPYEIYCSEHGVMMCVTCFLDGEHRQHTMRCMDLDTAVSHVTEQINHDIDNASHRAGAAEELLMLLSKAKRELKDSAEEAEQEIDSVYERLLSDLKARKQALHDMVAHEFGDREAVLQNQEEQLLSILPRLRTAVVLALRFMSTSDTYRLLDLSELVRERVQLAGSIPFEAFPMASTSLKMDTLGQYAKIFGVYRPSLLTTLATQASVQSTGAFSNAPGSMLQAHPEELPNLDEVLKLLRDDVAGLNLSSESKKKEESTATRDGKSAHGAESAETSEGSSSAVDRRGSSESMDRATRSITFTAFAPVFHRVFQSLDARLDSTIKLLREMYVDSTARRVRLDPSDVSSLATQVKELGDLLIKEQSKIDTILPHLQTRWNHLSDGSGARDRSMFNAHRRRMEELMDRHSAVARIVVQVREETLRGKQPFVDAGSFLAAAAGSGYPDFISAMQPPGADGMPSSKRAQPGSPATMADVHAPTTPGGVHGPGRRRSIPASSTQPPMAAAAAALQQLVHAANSPANSPRATVVGTTATTSPGPSLLQSVSSTVHNESGLDVKNLRRISWRRSMEFRVAPNRSGRNSLVLLDPQNNETLLPSPRDTGSGTDSQRNSLSVFPKESLSRNSSISGPRTRRSNTAASGEMSELEDSFFEGTPNANGSFFNGAAKMGRTPSPDVDKLNSPHLPS